MNRGAVLYRDIWDNKPPLLYAIYALWPSLLWAKTAATLSVIGVCVFVWLIVKKILIHSRGAKMTAGLFFQSLIVLAVGVLLSIPRFEGTIANAELFFILPIVVGGYLIFGSYQFLTTGESKLINFKLAGAGILAFTAFLFKAPAVFDFAGMFLFLTVLQIEKYLQTKSAESFLKSILKISLNAGVPFFVLLALTFGVFYFNGATGEFINAVFLQNASYISVGAGALTKFSNPLFLRGLLLVLGIIILSYAYLKKLVSKPLLFFAFWLGFSIYGALLSNRAYNHYLLQLFPPAVLFTGYVFYEIFFVKQFRIATIATAGVFVSVAFYLSQMFHGAFALRTVPYYQNWADYLSGQKSKSEFVNFFDARTQNLYLLAEYIDEESFASDSIFVWGDIAAIYVLADRPAATKFIQAHHLTTIDPKNYDLTYEKLIKEKPKFIVVKRPENFSFPKLELLLAKNYKKSAVFVDLHLYRLTETSGKVYWEF